MMINIARFRYRSVALR